MPAACVLCLRAQGRFERDFSTETDVNGKSPVSSAQGQAPGVRADSPATASRLRSTASPRLQAPRRLPRHATVACAASRAAGLVGLSGPHRYARGDAMKLNVTCQDRNASSAC
jgi:hypothetical protein